MTFHDWTAIIIAGSAFIIFVTTIFAHDGATRRLDHEALGKVSDGNLVLLELAARILR